MNFKVPCNKSLWTMCISFLVPHQQAKQREVSFLTKLILLVQCISVSLMYLKLLCFKSLNKFLSMTQSNKISTNPKIRMKKWCQILEKQMKRNNKDKWSNKMLKGFCKNAQKSISHFLKSKETMMYSSVSVKTLLTKSKSSKLNQKSA